MTFFGKILAKCFGTQAREGHTNKPKDAANCCGHITGSDAEQCFADMAKLSEKRKSQGAHESVRINRKKTLVRSDSVRSDVSKPERISPSMTESTAMPSPSTSGSAAPSCEALCTPKGIYASDPPPILPISSRQSRIDFLSRNSSVPRGMSDLQGNSSGKITPPPMQHAYKQRSVSAGVATEGANRKPLQQALKDLSIKQTGLQRSQSVKVTKTETDFEKRVSLKEEAEVVDCDSLKCEKTPLSEQLDHENEQLRLSKKKAKQLHRQESSGRPPRQQGAVQGRAMRISNDDTRATMSMSSDSESASVSASIGYFTSFETQLTPPTA